MAICRQISERYEIHFVEIGLHENHVHFWVQSLPALSVKEIAQTIKSITAKEVFRRHPEVKKELWSDSFWTIGYYVNTIGQYTSEDIICRYIFGQGKSKESKEYKKVYSSQLRLSE
ncbi:IS200/IS605 family transposase [Rhizosphaericola mali]|uniref:IS200/IS605 family transposase n=1 Tax=Rhizosphaericola mali TaxID=2545455 RepID=A0A5P2G1C3_9BACT|nr:IS200/IS605 family transposase [Rhizosphaericola mali]